MKQPTLIDVHRLAWLAALTLTLHGCGADAAALAATPPAPESAQAEPGPGTASPASSPFPSPSPSPALANTSACNIPSVQSALLQQVNTYRAAGATCGGKVYPPSPPVAWNARLESAATAHATDMASRDFMSHTGSNDSSMAQRVDETSYQWRAVAENVAGGQTSVSAVMSGWMTSPEHCHNVMDASLEHVGAACMQNPDTLYKLYWAMVFARPR